MRKLLAVPCCLAVAMTACSRGPAGTVETSIKSAATKLPPSPNPYTLFETLQVRPLALSPNGKLLFAANTPDNRLEIFNVRKGGLDPVGSVEVGLEPVAVAARTQNEVWVVNHLSDSVSIVDVSVANNARVTRTLLVGDEPRDIVFAGAAHDRAFITTAHRGQNTGDDPDLFNPAAGRADVWVFDANALGSAPGGQRLAKLTFFADTPRALAASADGSRVYAAAFLSGNQTTTVSAEAVGKAYPNGMPEFPALGPFPTPAGPQMFPQPVTGLIVKYKNGHWVDAYGTNFDAAVRVVLPDNDVFAIDANATPPAPVANGTFNSVGTTLFNAAVNPKSGKIYVSNTDAHNDVRFEGDHPGAGTSVRGNIVDSRISVLDPASHAVAAVNLNPHIDHTADTGDPTLSVAFPQDLTVSSDGATLYVVAQGSSKLAIYATADVEAGHVAATAASQVTVTGGGPTGVVLDERNGQAFVLTRFDDGISTVDVGARVEVAHRNMFNPEPTSVTAGRAFLYDAAHTSTHGDQACASCHIGGDFDALAWDLGNPAFFPLPITQTVAQESDLMAVPIAAIETLLGKQQTDYVFAFYQPLKGPMTTQSLRGLDNHGAMHWRGDRNGAIQQTGTPFLDGNNQPVVTAQPNGGMFDEFNAFNSFDVAFGGLVEGPTLTAAQMSAFTTFILQATYPPNPIHNLDDTLTADQQAGHDFYFNKKPDGSEAEVDHFHDCNGCHKLDRGGNQGATAHPGFFGTDGRLSFENEQQLFKIPHLRNAYQKVGMFGSSPDQQLNVASVVPQLNPTVPAVRGFGYLHDGTIGSLEHFLTPVSFLQSTAFATFNGVTVPPNPYGIPFFNDPTKPFDPSSGLSLDGLKLRHVIAEFVLAFDSNMKPIVGQQVTLTTADAAAAGDRITLLETQAAAGNCDLVVRGFVRGRDSGFVYSGGQFLADTTTTPPLSDAALRALVGEATDALTFTAVPPGSGLRIGIDRDGDGYADGDELAAGTNPADPNSHP